MCPLKHQDSPKGVKRIFKPPENGLTYGCLEGTDLMTEESWKKDIPDTEYKFFRDLFLLGNRHSNKPDATIFMQELKDLQATKFGVSAAKALSCRPLRID